MDEIAKATVIDGNVGDFYRRVFSDLERMAAVIALVSRRKIISFMLLKHMLTQEANHVQTQRVNPHEANIGPCTCYGNDAYLLPFMYGNYPAFRILAANISELLMKTVATDCYPLAWQVAVAISSVALENWDPNHLVDRALVQTFPRIPYETSLYAALLRSAQGKTHFILTQPRPKEQLAELIAKLHDKRQREGSHRADAIIDEFIRHGAQANMSRPVNQTWLGDLTNSRGVTIVDNQPVIHRSGQGTAVIGILEKGKPLEDTALQDLDAFSAIIADIRAATVCMAIACKATILATRSGYGTRSSMRQMGPDKKILPMPDQVLLALPWNNPKLDAHNLYSAADILQRRIPSDDVASANSG